MCDLSCTRLSSGRYSCSDIDVMSLCLHLQCISRSNKQYHKRYMENALHVYLSRCKLKNSSVLWFRLKIMLQEKNVLEVSAHMH